MYKKSQHKNGFLLIEALLFIIASTMVMYYFSLSIAHAHTQYRQIQLYNYAQQTLYVYTKQAQMHNASLVDLKKNIFCDCEFMITQQHIPAEELHSLSPDAQYIQTRVSWHDKNKKLHTLTMNVIPWNIKVDLA